VVIREFEDASVQILNNDLWKNCGCCLDVEYQSAKYFVFFAKYFDGERWQLTIEPISRLRLLTWIFAKKATPHQVQLRGITDHVHKALKPIANNLSICLSSTTKNIRATVGELNW
jgi:hypothetical protein